MRLATLDQVVWLTSSEDLNPRVNRTKGAVTRACSALNDSVPVIRPCHMHSVTHTHTHTEKQDWFSSPAAAHVRPASLTAPHMCFLLLLLYLEKLSIRAMRLLIYACCTATCFEGELTGVSGGTHLISLSAEPGRVSLICEGKVRGTGEAQTFPGGPLWLRLTDRHISKAQSLSFSGSHPEIWDTHWLSPRNSFSEMNTGIVHLKHGDLVQQKT